MPYFAIQTNRNVAAQDQAALGKASSAFVAELLGKPEAYVMTALSIGTPMTFGGSDAPTAMVQLKSIGLDRERCPELSKRICGFLQEQLNIPPERIFIDFKVLDGGLFGWNGKTF